MREPESSAEAGAAGDFMIGFGGETAHARPSGALWIPGRSALVAADLHLGKAERLARRGGPLLPPYEIDETLTRLEREIAATEAATVFCLGDSFDDPACAAALTSVQQARVRALTGARDWVWIAGNHDPQAPQGLGGRSASEARLGGAVLRHIAEDCLGDAAAEASGHFHPKAVMRARGRRLSRRCFLWDGRRLILPAFGAYTGGLSVRDAAFDGLLGPEATALVLGRSVRAAPRSRCA